MITIDAPPGELNLRQFSTWSVHNAAEECRNTNVKELAAETGFQNGSGQIGRREARSPASAGEQTLRRSHAFRTELEGQLDGARAADLVEGVEAAICAAGAEAVRQRLRRISKQRTG